MTNPVGSSFRVLLVDDFAVVKLMIRNALKKLGVTDISEANNGVEALELIHKAQAENRQFDLVLSDWNMPKMGGHELLKEIRKYSELVELKVVLITATAEQHELAVARNLGVTDTLIKPIAPDLLQKELEAILTKVRKAS
jgi:two-component system chemotaxis response regulator CheY